MIIENITSEFQISNSVKNNTEFRVIKYGNIFYATGTFSYDNYSIDLCLFLIPQKYLPNNLATIGICTGIQSNDTSSYGLVYFYKSDSYVWARMLYTSKTARFGVIWIKE